jgi:hypothetical protein
MVEAHVVEGFGLSSLVVDGLVQAERLFRMAERVGVLIPPVAKQAETSVDLGLAKAVAELPIQGEAGRVVNRDLVVVAKGTTGIGQETTGHCLPGGVVEARSRGEGGDLRGGRFEVVPSYCQKGRHGPWDLPGMGIVPGLGGKADRGQQHVVFSLEPCQCLPVIRGMLGGDARPGRRDADRLKCGVQDHSGAAGAVQVVVECLVDGGLALVLVVEGPGLVGGVGAKQVVEGIPAGNVLGDQAVAGELG